MSKEIEYRYLFLVRQPFGKSPQVDSFYQLTVPPGLTGEQAQIMTVLNPDFCQKELSQDGNAIKGMSLRLRFNTDIYQKICLVKTTRPIDAETLDAIIVNHHREGTLMEFLKGAEI